DFLPEPDVPEVIIENERIRHEDEENILHDTVQQVYVINRDDFNMREILLQPEGDRGAWFDGLRKNYPIRREFQNTKVVVPGIDCCLVNKAAGIGFEVGL
ncbi:MAG: DUF3410 domain-containing protein, partial [Planctomycetota bacterium]